MPRSSQSDELVAAGRRLAGELRSARQQREISAARVAEAAGVSVDTIRRIEAGRVTNPGFFTVAAVADVIGVPLVDLLAAAMGDVAPVAWPRQST